MTAELRTTAEGRAVFVASMPPCHMRRHMRPDSETPGAAWWVIDLCDDITDLVVERDMLELLVKDLTERAEKAERQLGSLLDFTERHQLSHADHDHDCYELWCIERDYSRRLIEGDPDA